MKDLSPFLSVHHRFRFELLSVIGHWGAAEDEDYDLSCALEDLDNHLAGYRSEELCELVQALLPLESAEILSIASAIVQSLQPVRG